MEESGFVVATLSHLVRDSGFRRGLARTLTGKHKRKTHARTHARISPVISRDPLPRVTTAKETQRLLSQTVPERSQSRSIAFLDCLLARHGISLHRRRSARHLRGLPRTRWSCCRGPASGKALGSTSRFQRIAAAAVLPRRVRLFLSSWFKRQIRLLVGPPVERTGADR